jgi:hypothetical protein
MDNGLRGKLGFMYGALGLLCLVRARGYLWPQVTLNNICPDTTFVPRKVVGHRKRKSCLGGIF